MQSKSRATAARASCRKELWILAKPSGFYRLFPGKQQLFHCNECMHNGGVAYHMTIFQIMNTSDADGKHFNLSKNDCTRCCQNGLAAAITVPFLISEGEKKGKCCAWKPQMDWNDTDKNISSDETSYGHRVIKMMCIHQWQDRNCSVVQWVRPQQIYMFCPQRLPGSSSSILTQRVGKVDPAKDKSYWFKLSNDLIFEVLRDTRGGKHWSYKMQFYDSSCHI